MIRKITTLVGSDKEQIEKLAVQFFSESKTPGTLNFQHFCNVMESMMQPGHTSMWVLEEESTHIIKGAIGGIITPHLFTGELVAIEMFWFVEASFRRGLSGIRLLNTFFEWAKEKKATVLHMGYMDAIHPQHVANFYIKLGFTPLETVFTKRV